MGYCIFAPRSIEVSSREFKKIPVVSRRGFPLVGEILHVVMQLISEDSENPSERFVDVGRWLPHAHTSPRDWLKPRDLLRCTCLEA